MGLGVVGFGLLEGKCMYLQQQTPRIYLNMVPVLAAIQVSVLSKRTPNQSIITAMLQACSGAAFQLKSCSLQHFEGTLLVDVHGIAFICS